MDYLPLFANVAQRPVLLVGGGEVALRKARLLLEAEARKKSAFVLYAFPVQGVLCACAHVDIPRTKAKK
jgi:hypothetical protein